jgi:hypothetical protein
VAGENPVITASPDGLLVAWVSGSYSIANILAERVSPTLEVVAPGAFVVSLGPNPQRGPVAVATDDGAFVVWTDYRSGTAEIYGLRLTATGGVLDPDGIRIAAGSWPRVATNGIDFLVVWSDGGATIRAVRVSGAGEVLDPEPLTLKETPAEDLAQAGPVVASAGGNYLVAWNEIEFPIPEIATPNRQVLGTIVTAAGEIHDPGGINLDDGGRGSAPAIASNGDEYLLAWRDCRAGCPENLEGQTRAMRIGADGALLDDGSITFPERDAISGPRPEAASDGDGFLVVAVRGAARVSADGTVLDDTWIELEGLDADVSAAAFGDGAYLVVGAAFQDNVRAERVSPSGVSLDPPGIALADGTSPSVAYLAGADGFLVLYTRGFRNRARFVTP